MAVQKGVADRWQEADQVPHHRGLRPVGDLAGGHRQPFSAGDFTGTIGLPLPSTDIAIRDDDGNDLPLGEVGEICIRGPQVMAGYWNRPDETAKVMTNDGFFKSGDMGFMDERGFTKIVDRKKDMILVSGFNVYPNELEEVVAACSGRAGSGGDRRAGRAFRRSAEAVHRQEGPGLTEEAVKAYCQREPDRLQAAAATSSSAPNCRRRRRQDLAAGAEGLKQPCRPAVCA